MTGTNPALDGIRPTTTTGASELAGLLDLIRPPAWHADALCKEHPELDWFPTRGENEMTQAVQAVCRRCLVRDECLAAAVEHTELHGIWGGTTSRQRRVIFSKRAADRRQGATDE